MVVKRGNMQPDRVEAHIRESKQLVVEAAELELGVVVAVVEEEVAEKAVEERQLEVVAVVAREHPKMRRMNTYLSFKSTASYKFKFNNRNRIGKMNFV